MTAPNLEPSDLEPGGAEAVAELRSQLATGDGTRLARYARRTRAGIWLLTVLVSGTGLLALLVGAAAWRGSPFGPVVVAALTLPAIVLPLYVARRTAALADAAAHPRELVQQLQDLVGQVRDSTELRTLATRLTRRGVGGRTAGSGRGPGRLRGALSLARLASTVVGQAEPDPARHRYLVPFTPERLGHTWSAVGLSLWAWLVAGVVLVVAFPLLALSLV